jgi:2-oxoisovalerate dehydrogenase E2 component (dihydrolipoyl transacylase)
MDFQLPELGEGVYEADMVRWLVNPGDTVKAGQGLMEVLTDKATMEVPAPFSGTITELRAEPGATIRVGDHILSYSTGGKSAQAEPAKASTATATKVEARPSESAKSRNGPPSVTTSTVAVKASPSVRQLARKLGVDLSQIRGTGPGGRVLLDDLQIPTSPLKPSASPKRSAAAKLETGQAGTKIKLVGIRKSIAKHLVESKRIVPHYAYVDECDLSELVKFRASLREPFEKLGVKLTYLPFFVKAAVAALKEVPIANASLNDETGEIALHDQYHIGIATATSQGLIVPVIRDADKKDIATIAREIERLSDEARAGKSKLEDLRGGTFTITSIGSIGGLIATPIINHPEVAILGIGKVVKRPVFDAHGHVNAADMVYLSLSFDHRVVDGAIGAIFGNALIEQLQNPARLLLG